MRDKVDLSGLWDGELKLNPELDVAAPEIIRKSFYVPLSWNMQTKDLQWPSEQQELSAITRPLQNQNFRDKERKFSEGVITYQKDIVLKKKQGMREFLVFEGSNYKTTVSINGKKVGENRNGHLKFEFDISDCVVDGENAFLITVDNFRDKDGCPQEQFNWKNYGGIYRPLYIEYRPDVYIKDYLVLPGIENGKWYADVNVSLSNKADTKLRVLIVSGTERKERLMTFKQSEYASFRFFLDNPVVWKSGEGNLSEIKLTLLQGNNAIDCVQGKFGFRTIETRGRDIFVNGETFRILGASFHEQHPAFGNSVPGWQWLNDLKLLKHCGLNAVRAAHYPYSQEFYDVCDSEGIVCIAELPCWQFNKRHFESASILKHCTEYAETMIRQLGNHPSIISWCIQNESKTFEPEAANFFAEINTVFKKNDPSRFTLTAESPETPEHLAVIKKVKGSPCGEVPATSKLIDVFGINDYSGWYGEKSSYFPQLLDHVAAQVNDKPVIVSEFGAEASSGMRSLSMPYYSEDFQAELLCRHIREILRRDFIAGFFIWLFFDYECSSISISGINAKGIVDSYRNPKLAFNIIKNIIKEKKHND
jgi:beta-glucuronidase